jgi:REP element-mobilizing transposase RayT
VNFPPAVAVSRLVNSLKDVSSRRMRQEFPELLAPALTTSLKAGALADT